MVVVEPEPVADDRGFFARSWCADEFAAHGLDPALGQCSISFNHRALTLRGMHWQAAPHGESKLVRCTAGAVHDVALDLRSGSPTNGLYFGIGLTASNRAALFIPPGVAHGFLTLADDTELLYQISVPFHAPSARGVRWDDPAFAIEWPADPLVISERDLAYPDYRI